MIVTDYVRQCKLEKDYRASHL